MAGTLTTPYRRGAGGHLMIALAKRLNPLFSPVASSGLIGVMGVIHHTGRRSRRAFATPIAIRPTADGFVIPLPYSESTDWCRNVRASGSAVVTWSGTDYAVTSPEVVDQAIAAPAFPAALRFMLRLFGIRRFLLLRKV